MPSLIVKTLNTEKVLKSFDHSLLDVWSNIAVDYHELANMLKHKTLVPILKTQAASYIALIELIKSAEDGQYLIDLFNYNICNEESLGLLFNAVYLIYKEGAWSVGVKVFINYIVNNPNCPKEFYLIAGKYML